jgi:hypothetical protein
MIFRRNKVASPFDSTAWKLAGLLAQGRRVAQIENEIDVGIKTRAGTSPFRSNAALQTLFREWTT